MAISKLTDHEREALLGAHPAWALVRDGTAIRREFRFTDFSEAWAFMARVALLAERHDHHPEWSNVYNRVEIELTTHDAGGLSARDAQMAAEIDAL